MNPPTNLEGRPKCSEKGCGRWMDLCYKTNSSKSFRRWQRKKGVWLSHGLCKMHMRKKYKMWPYDIKGMSLSRIIGRPNRNRAFRRGQKDTLAWGRPLACLAILASLLLGSIMAYAVACRTTDGQQFLICNNAIPSGNFYQCDNTSYYANMSVLIQQETLGPTIANRQALSCAQVALNQWENSHAK